MKKIEDKYREMFVSDRSNELLSDPYLLLIPVFDCPSTFEYIDFQTDQSLRISCPLLFNFEDPYNSRLYNFNSQQPALTQNLHTFKQQFYCFTCGLLTGLNWDNVFCAGGAVLAAMQDTKISEDYAPDKKSYEIFSNTVLGEEEVMFPVTKKKIVTEEYDDWNTRSYWRSSKKRKTRKVEKYALSHIQKYHQKLFDYYEKDPYKESDVDLFLYGLTESEAEKKVWFFRYAE